MDLVFGPTDYGQGGVFSLRYSELTNLAGYSRVPYPAGDIYVEHNMFINTAGFAVMNLNAQVYIRYNLFKGNSGFLVQNIVSYGESETIVKYNSFIDTNGIILELVSGYSPAAMVATENYWGTQDTNLIDSMIYDKNDDIILASHIEYLPILSEPPPETRVWDVAAPSTSHSYDGRWHNTDFRITLTATDDIFGVAETYYKINDGQTQNLSAHGQPLITSESANNKLEYWSVDRVGNEETPHKILTNIKLDKTKSTADAGQDQTVNVGVAVTFDAGGSSDNVGIVSYEWDFGDGTTGTGKTTTHTYANPGNYTATLTVEDAAGNTSTDTLTVTVLATEVFPMWTIGVVIAAIGIIIATTLLWKKRKA